ncbi:acyltransferase [Sphingobacterium chuzhouense]|uniref:Acyltransferase n=1 Tax=Sphingobacterium chuzhouense TaxID=1742264 RepID=A0ABR7XXI3_9SPHI|nr:acyltransferase [Sphingobacterium chuzhouense]MBD1423770.1 acyltransferase [Sphingobacterium chuzhouense]
MSQITIQLRYVLPLWFVLLITNWLPDNRFTIKLRGTLARPFFKRCGKRLELGRDLTLLNSYNIEIGNDVYIAKGGWLNGMGGLIIEDEVVLAPYVVISTMQHVFRNNSVRFGGSLPGKIVIGKGTWLAAHVAVKCGVTVGKGCIVGANAFVVKDTEDNAIYGGVPAKFIKENRDSQFSIYSSKELLDSINDNENSNSDI